MAHNGIDMERNEIIEFATWYSGMDREKVERAYKRYLKECSISGVSDSSEKPLTQCMVGRDAECNHPKCPVTDEDVQNGKHCTLPLYDWRE
jgi:hypothetical protein